MNNFTAQFELEQHELSHISSIKKICFGQKYMDEKLLYDMLIKYNTRYSDHPGILLINILCLFDVILYIPYEYNEGIKIGNTLISQYIDIYNDHKILDHGEELIHSFENIPCTILLPSKVDKHGIFHTYFIGIQVANIMRKTVPNFVYTYGCFKIIKPKDTNSYEHLEQTLIDKKKAKFEARIKNKSQKSYKTNRSHKIYRWYSDMPIANYLIIETIEGQLLTQYMTNCNFEEFLSWFLQIIIAIQSANDMFKFTHYNLHTNSIIMKKIENIENTYINYQIKTISKKQDTQEIETKIEDIYIKSKYIPMIINYGRAYCEIDDKKFGYVGMENDGVLFQSRIWYDIYKLLCACLYNMYKNNNTDTFNKTLKIYELIIDPEHEISDENIIKQLLSEHDTGFIYSTEITNGELLSNGWDFLLDIKELYPIIYNNIVITDITKINHNQIYDAHKLAPLFNNDGANLCEEKNDEKNNTNINSFEEIIRLYRTTNSNNIHIPQDEINQYCHNLHRQKDTIEELLLTVKDDNISKFKNVVSTEVFINLIDTKIQLYIHIKDLILCYIKQLEYLDYYIITSQDLLSETSIQQNEKINTEKFTLSVNLNKWLPKYEQLRKLLEKLFVNDTDIIYKEELIKIMLPFNI